MPRTKYHWYVLNKIRRVWLSWKVCHWTAPDSITMVCLLQTVKQWYAHYRRYGNGMPTRDRFPLVCPRQYTTSMPQSQHTRPTSGATATMPTANK